MDLKRLGLKAAMVWVLALVAAGDGSGAADDPKESCAEATEARQARPVPTFHAELSDESWPLSLREAIRIGLENSRAVQIVAPDAPGPANDGAVAIAIAPTAPEVKAPRFKAQVMALVRSIEQEYRGLSHRYVHLWAVRRAAEVAEEIVNRAKTVTNVRYTSKEIVEAGDQVEGFRLDASVAPADVINTERRLRKLLGLAVDDGRRIVPTTAMLDAKREYIWDSCLATMLAKRPDVVEAMERVKSRKAQQADLDKITQMVVPGAVDDGPFTPSPSFVSEWPDAPGLKTLEQTTRNATQSLQRTFREIDANYEKCQEARKFRTAALERLAERRTLLNEGRATIQRCHDAISQYAQAVDQEAQLKAAYNIAIVDLEAAKGTLLEYENIEVVERPRADATPKPEDAPAEPVPPNTP